MAAAVKTKKAKKGFGTYAIGEIVLPEDLSFLSNGVPFRIVDFKFDFSWSKKKLKFLKSREAEAFDMDAEERVPATWYYFQVLGIQGREICIVRNRLDFNVIDVFESVILPEAVTINNLTLGTLYKPRNIVVDTGRGYKSIADYFPEIDWKGQRLKFTRMVGVQHATKDLVGYILTVAGERKDIFVQCERGTRMFHSIKIKEF